MESLLLLMFTLFSRDFSEGELHRTEIMIKIKGRWFSLFVSLCFSKLFHCSFTYFLVCIHVLIGLTSVVSKQRHQFLSVYTLFYLFSFKTQQCIQIKKPLQSSLCIINIVIRITIIVILKNKKMLYKVPYISTTEARYIKHIIPLFIINKIYWDIMKKKTKENK